MKIYFFKKNINNLKIINMSNKFQNLNGFDEKNYN